MSSMRNFNRLRPSACITVSAAALLLGCQTSLPTERLTDTRPAKIASVRPPPLTGGTLLITADERFAVASDPERDRIVIVDLTSQGVKSIALEAKDEPARLVEDTSGMVHVALRGGGSIVTIDPVLAQQVSRRTVCSDPRGLAIDRTKNLLHVACASGELVSLDVEPEGDVVRRVVVEPDLRDVLVSDGHLRVTTFRSAELLELTEAGAVKERFSPSNRVGEVFEGTDEMGVVFEVEHTPQVAWRTVSVPSTGETIMIHQLSRTTAVDLAPPEPVEPDPVEPIPEEDAAYASGESCDSNLVLSAATVFGQFGTALGRMTGTSSLPIDAAISNNGQVLAIIDPTKNGIVEFSPNALENPDELPAEEVSVDENGDETIVISSTCPIDVEGFVTQTDVTPIAVSYGNSADYLYVQTREPASLSIYYAGELQVRIPFGGSSMEDTGLDMFHNLSGQETLSGLACASCHPEGRDDGHVWNFGEDGIRRTQSLAGTLKGTEPFHWAGDLPTMTALISEVFTGRMGGPKEPADRVAALKTWLEELKPLRPAVGPVTAIDEEAPGRGQALYESTEVGCASCHGGSALTNNQTVDVGSGGKFQVPSLLGIGMRAPYMHDGCAKTLADRFTSCGGDDHGNVSDLEASQIADLVAYLETL